MARFVLIGPSAAAELCGISPQLMRARALAGKVRVVRRRPTLRFRLIDILAARDAMVVKDVRGRKPALKSIIKGVLA